MIPFQPQSWYGLGLFQKLLGPWNFQSGFLHRTQKKLEIYYKSNLMHGDCNGSKFPWVFRVGEERPTRETHRWLSWVKTSVFQLLPVPLIRKSQLKISEKPFCILNPNLGRQHQMLHSSTFHVIRAFRVQLWSFSCDGHTLPFRKLLMVSS